MYRLFGSTRAVRGRGGLLQLGRRRAACNVPDGLIQHADPSVIAMPSPDVAAARPREAKAR
jgi:hypothetical protein